MLDRLCDNVTVRLGTSGWQLSRLLYTMTKTTMKRPSKAQVAREQVAKDERRRILWIINDMMFTSESAEAIATLRNLHKKILDTAE